MGEGSGAPVAAGLAVGIAFVVLFSAMIKPDFMMSDEELVAKYSELAEVKYFLEKYPDAKVEVDRNPVDEGAEVLFVVEKQVNPSGKFYTGIHILTIRVLAQSFHVGLYISCGFGSLSTLGSLESIDEIDAVEQMCFPATDAIGGFEPDPDGDLMGRIFLTIENNANRSNSNEVISLHKGCGLSPVCHAHSISIYGNGTALHREYDREGDRIYIFQIPQNDTAKLFSQFYEADLSMPENDKRRGTDIVYYEMSFTTDGKTTKVFYPGSPPTPQNILDLDLQIEQLTEKYDDRVIDCTDHSLTACHIREPVDQTQSNEDDETGVFEPETDVGEPIPVEVSAANNTSIEITYTED